MPLWACRLERNLLANRWPPAHNWRTGCWEVGMRLRNILVVLPLLVVVSFAQETNFSVGPQYLITNGSPISLRPIATPTLSLGETQPFVPAVSPTEIVAEVTPSTPSAPSD